MNIIFYYKVFLFSNLLFLYFLVRRYACWFSGRGGGVDCLESAYLDPSTGRGRGAGRVSVYGRRQALGRLQWLRPQELHRYLPVQARHRDSLRVVQTGPFHSETITILHLCYTIFNYFPFSSSLMRFCILDWYKFLLLHFWWQTFLNNKA